MQRKLLRLQQEHLSAFQGSSLSDIAVPKMSKIERERKQAQQAALEDKEEVKPVVEEKKSQ